MEIGFSKILVLMLLALLVLGPEKLPKLAAQLGRWTGRARTMARNLRMQLEQEISYEELVREKEKAEAALRAATATQPVTPPPTAATTDSTPSVVPQTPTHEATALPIHNNAQQQGHADSGLDHSVHPNSDPADSSKGSTT